MIKMRCIRDHATTVWGSPVAGEIFEVQAGYVAQLEAAGLAERVDAPDEVQAALAELQTITGQNTPVRRGRRGRQ